MKFGRSVESELPLIEDLLPDLSIGGSVFVGASFKVITFS